MWLNQETEEAFDAMCLVACKSHQQEATKLKNYDKIVKKEKDFFWTMKYGIMKDKYQITGENEVVDIIRPAYCNRLKLRDDRKAFLEYDSICTYALADLSKVCCICEGMETEDDLIDYYQNLNRLNIEPSTFVTVANKYAESFPLFHEIKNIFHSDEQTIQQALGSCFYCFGMMCGSTDTVIHKIGEKMDKEQGQDSSRIHGNKEYQNGNYVKALEIYTLGISIETDNFYLYGNRAQTLLKMQMFDKAEVDCRTYITLQPNRPRGYIRLAEAVFCQKRIHEALQICDFGIKYSDPSYVRDFAALKKYEKTLIKDCERCPKPKESTEKSLPANGSVAKMEVPIREYLFICNGHLIITKYNLYS